MGTGSILVRKAFEVEEGWQWLGRQWRRKDNAVVEMQKVVRMVKVAWMMRVIEVVKVVRVVRVTEMVKVRLG